MVLPDERFFCGVNIGCNGHVKQKQQFLPKIARGDILFSYAITEPNAGTDAASVQMTAGKHTHRGVGTLDGR